MRDKFYSAVKAVDTQTATRANGVERCIEERSPQKAGEHDGKIHTSTPRKDQWDFDLL